MRPLGFGVYLLVGAALWGAVYGGVVKQCGSEYAKNRDSLSVSSLALTMVAWPALLAVAGGMALADPPIERCGP